MKPIFENALDAWRNESIPTPDLTVRFTGAAVADFRFRKRVKTCVRFSSGTAAVIAIALAVWFFGKSDERLQATARPMLDPFRESTHLMTTVSKSMKFETPSLLISESFHLDTTAYLPNTHAERFKAIPETARASMEPVTLPASKAMNRFVKDFGAAFALPKPKM